MIRVLFLTFFSVIQSTTLSAQEARLSLVKQLLTDTTIRGEVVFQPTETRQTPATEKERRTAVNLLSLTQAIIANHHGVFLGMEANDGIYQAHEARTGIQFIRLDSTQLDGSYQSAYLFSYQDTLFSLGGYAHWQFNGHLRFFNAHSQRWEITPLNKKLPVLKSDPGMHYDQAHGAFYYVDQQRQADNGVAPDASPEKITSTTLPYMYVLDLKTKKWKEQGTVTPEFYKIIFRYEKIASTPMGSLLMAKNKHDHNAYLIDYEHNRIYVLNNPQKWLALQPVTQTPANLTHQEEDLATYYHDNTLHLFSTQRGHQTIPLTLSDFKSVPYSIVTHEGNNNTVIAGNSIKQWLSVSLMAFILIPSLAFLLMYRKNKIISRAALARLPVEKVEQKILEALANAPDHALNAHDIDLLIGGNPKSIDSKNKSRTMVIRSINTKYQELTGNTDDLITHVRMDTDKRMFRYVLDMQRYHAVMHPDIPKK